MNDASPKSPLLPAWLSVSLIVLVAIRVAGIVWSALTNIRGDYYASLPGAYVRTVNPTLWDSPDLQGTWGYHANTYFHGPVQYLTLYAMAWFNSYHQIAMALLPIYGLLLVWLFVLMVRISRRLAPDTVMTVPLLAATFLFFPLLQAYLQREFEVVTTVVLAWALSEMLDDRRRAGGALLAYVAWFKYTPLLFAGYLGLRQWWAALGAFVVTSLVILGLAHALFGLPLFFNNNVPGHASQVFALWDYTFYPNPQGHLIGTGFCTGWFDNESTLANVRHGLCTVSAGARWVPASAIYLLICLIVAVVYLQTHWRLERRPPAAGLERDRERWRRALEVSIVTAVCACFFFAHYYYLIVLVVPFNVLLMRYLSGARYRMLVPWLASYALVSAFLVPIGVLSRIAGRDMWEPFIWGGWFLYGELLLVGLLLREYRSLAR